ncbi:MAG: serine/threonine-protein kinase [Cyanobacteria bacterium REEB67]|nr:serine/threonine-protein kinase [Cyanobacteria bacterium REEB67]
MRKVCLTCKKEYDDDRTACPDDGGDLMPLMQDPMIGTVIADKYELLSVLGVGGMSTIYKAKHKYMGRMAAVKLLHPYLVADASMFQRFQYEAKAASNLNHPNVVAIYDFGITSGGTAYLVMDYLEGEDLSGILEREALLPEAQALEIFRQAAAGLAHAHSKGVIHRDLKPSNLFLCPEGDGRFNVKLVDFGIAKITDVDGTSEPAQNLTRSGEVFGSPLYMSPEQCSGKPLDVRSDIYSLGCVMYEVLTGRRPLAGATAIDTMHKHLKEMPPPFREIAPTLQVSEKLEAAVRKCLAKKPDDRFACVSDFYKEVYGEELPQSASVAVRNNSPSVNLDVRASSGPSGAVPLTDFSVASNLTGANGARLAPSASAQHKLYKWILPGSATLALGAIALCGAVVWVLFYWEGPANDHGPLIDRWRYTYHLAQGERQLAQQHYEEAATQYKEAQALATKFGDNFGRLMNVYRSELTLYRQSRQYDKQEEVIAAMATVNRKRAFLDLNTAMKEVNSIEEILQAKKKGLSHLNKTELELQLSAVIGGIRDIARRLGAVQEYDSQETLLNRTIATYRQLVGEDDPQLAALDLDLAECHVNQDEFTEARPLFKQSLEIYTLAHKNGRNNVQTLDVAKAWLRIGQFDRDRSIFKEADKELKQAYEMLRPYGQKNPPAEEPERGLKLLIECLNALSDYSDQTNNAADAKRYRLEATVAKKLRQQSARIDD